MEAELVARVQIPFRAIPAGGVHGVGPVRALRNGGRLLRGCLAAWRALGTGRPDAVFTTGGYVSVPVALAAWARRIPILLYLPDIEPGQSFRFVARLATRVAVTVEDSKVFLPSRKVAVTGYPLGERVRNWTRETGRKALQLPGADPVLLVFGGSRGARSINQAVLAHLEPLLDLAHVVHISGTLDWDAVASARERLSESLRDRYHAYAYLHDEMGAALAGADLVVSRAGASILGEFPFFGLPALLAPYPYAWRYQKVNAQWLAERDAAIVIEDADLDTRLVSEVRALLQDAGRRQYMADAASVLARPTAAQTIAALLISIGEVT